MKPELKDVFDPLEPPPGGLAALRRRFKREEPRLPYRGVLRGAVLACIVMAITAFSLWRLGPGWVAPRDVYPAHDLLAQHIDTDMHPVFIKLGLESPPSEPVSVPPARRDKLAVRRVPLEKDDVIFYLVASIDTP